MFFARSGIPFPPSTHDSSSSFAAAWLGDRPLATAFFSMNATSETNVEISFSFREKNVSMAAMFTERNASLVLTIGANEKDGA